MSVVAKIKDLKNVNIYNATNPDFYQGFSQHFVRFVGLVIGIAVAQLPIIIADPSFKTYIANHPSLAVFVPIAAALVNTLWTAWKNSAQNPPAVKK